MFIVDTSIWIDHLKRPVAGLSEILSEMKVLSHSTVLSELALGQIRNRSFFLGNLKLLPRAQEATAEEILQLIEDERLYGRGLSLPDVQILASALLSDAGVFTRDRALLSGARFLGVAVAGD